MGFFDNFVKFFFGELDPGDVARVEADLAQGKPGQGRYVPSTRTELARARSRAEAKAEAQPGVKAPTEGFAVLIADETPRPEDRLTVVLQVNREGGTKNRRRLYRDSKSRGEVIGVFNGGIYDAPGFGKGAVVATRPDWADAKAFAHGEVAGFEINSKDGKCPKVKFNFPDGFFDAVAGALEAVPADKTAQLVLRVTLTRGYKPDPNSKDVLVREGIAGYEDWERDGRTQLDYTIAVKVFAFAVVAAGHPLWVEFREQPTIGGGSHLVKVKERKPFNLDPAELYLVGANVPYEAAAKALLLSDEEIEAAFQAARSRNQAQADPEPEPVPATPAEGEDEEPVWD